MPMNTAAFGGPRRRSVVCRSYEGLFAILFKREHPFVWKPWL